MAEAGLRRSTRARTQVKTYAEEQAEEAGVIVEKPKRNGKKSNAHGEDAYLDVKSSKVVCPETQPPKKKKTTATASTSAADWHNDAATRRVEKRMRDIRRVAPGRKETRLLPEVDEPSDKYFSTLDRALGQKMFVLERTRGVEESCHANHADCPFEKLQIAGSKGNVYTISISHLTTCTCPVGIFSRKGKEGQCKHILYALHQVLRAPDHLKYQQAFFTAELKTLFANAPALPSQVADESEKDGNRKSIEGDCPICFTEFEAGDQLVWCRAACGNNLHAGCFRQWEQANRHVRCPFCRSDWLEDDGVPQKTQNETVTKVDMSARGMGGYYNVADQLDYDD